MLDFYWVRDDERFTPKLTSERMLGGLTFEEYTALDHLWAVLLRNGIRAGCRRENNGHNYELRCCSNELHDLDQNYSR